MTPPPPITLGDFDLLPPAPVPVYQSLTEFGCLWEMAASIAARTVVEIGSLYGGTLWYWLQLPNVELVVSVDLILDYEPMRPDVLAARSEWPAWCRAHNVTADELRVVEGDSHDPATLEAASLDEVDVLFIDGDHTYDGVEADFELWSPLVRPGGIVAFHDTVENGTRNEPGVRRLVSELKWRYPSIEFFAPDGAGITAFLL